MESKSKVYLGGVKVLSAFSGEVIMRMYEKQPREYANWYRTYLSARKVGAGETGRTRQEPTELEFEIAAQYIRGDTVRKIIENTGFTKERINSIIGRVGIWKMLHPKLEVIG